MNPMTAVLFCPKKILMRWVASGLLLTCQGVMSTEFDLDVLKARGISPEVAAYFSEAPRFSPGTIPVSVSINGNDKGTINAQFSTEGQLCMDAHFLQQAGLKIPSDLASASLDSSAKGDQTPLPCDDYATYYPGTTVSLFPNETRVLVVVPSDALAPVSTAPTGYLRGGMAGLLNYDMFSSLSKNQWDTSRHSYASLENGFNAGDWLVRSRQIINQSERETQFTALQTYAQRTFPSVGLQLQAGQINVRNSLFAIPSLSGMQIEPDRALNPVSGSGVTVTGIAQTAQARVEIKQNHQLIYSTLVPAGRFTLPDVPTISANTDLQVTVNETNGEQHHFVVSASEQNAAQLSQPEGLSFALGKVSQGMAGQTPPWVGSFSQGWRIHSQLNLSGGVLLAQGYQSLAARGEFTPRNNWLLKSSWWLSHDQQHSVQGQNLELSSTYRPLKNLAMTLHAGHKSAGYRHLSDSMYQNHQHELSAHTFGAYANWSLPYLGGFSLGYTGFVSQQTTQSINIGWGKTMGKVNIRADWQRSLGRSNTKNGADQLFVNFSLPWGEQHIDNYYRRSGTRAILGSGINTHGQIMPALHYSLAANHEFTEKHTAIRGSLNSNLHYTKINFSASVDTNRSQNYNVSTQGGVAAHAAGITFSPEPIQESFAIVKLDQKVAGIAIDTGQGRVWTDFWGQAVVPSLPAYQSSHVELNTETLPKNADVSNGLQSVKVGRGAVTQLNYQLLKERRALLNVTLPDGSPLPKDSLIVDSDQQYITSSVDNGVVFINNIPASGTLFVAAENGHEACRLMYPLNEQPDLEKYYETLAATCVFEKA